MSNQEILKLLQTCEDNVKDGGVFESNERAVIANHATGLSHTQMKNVFTYSAYLKFKGEEYRARSEKKKLTSCVMSASMCLRPLILGMSVGSKTSRSFSRYVKPVGTKTFR